MMLDEMGELAEAQWMYEEVLAGQAAQLGPVRIDTLRTKSNLACLLAQTRDLAGTATTSMFAGLTRSCCPPPASSSWTLNRPRSATKSSTLARWPAGPLDTSSRATT